MNTSIPLSCLALLAALGCTTAQAQNNIVKAGIIHYAPDSRTTGVVGIGIPPGADAQVGSATTAILVFERMLDSHVGVELVLGIPPKVSARATGTVAFLGDDVLSARNVAPTVLVNYHFGAPGDTWRPYVGVGFNYTRFASIKSSLAPKVEMSDSLGLAANVGVDYAISKQWSVFASVARVDVKSNLVATDNTVLTTTIDFRPTTYSLGLAYRF